MSDIDVRAINLNLLPALEAMLVEGSVGAAARHAHVTQSAMSHSLKKLRELFGDPLFVPSGRRMVPTPLAERVAATLSPALDQLARAVATPAPFEARTTRRAFRLATFDYFELAVMPRLVARLRALAPHASLEIERFSSLSMPRLVSGEIDLALLGGAQSVPSAGLRREEIAVEPFVVVSRRRHKRLDLEAFLARDHVLVSIEGRREGVVDRALAKLGRARRVALRVPHFFSALLAVARSNDVCTVPRSVATRGRELFGLAIHELPLDVPGVPVEAVWSRRTEDDEAARWFRALVIAVER